MIKEIEELIPKEFLDRSGRVFYSGRAAFAGKRRLYLLGVNPGGDPSSKYDETVRQHTERILNEQPDNWSAYRDESWLGVQPGLYPMQRRVLHLLRTLGMDPGEVPASNIAFLRSRDEASLKEDIIEVAESCWPFHRRVIESLGVRVVLCFGQTAGNWVRGKLGARSMCGEFIERNNRKWRSTAYDSPQGIKVVVATHPSRTAWTNPVSDPGPLVANMMGTPAPGGEADPHEPASSKVYNRRNS